MKLGYIILAVSIMIEAFLFASCASQPQANTPPDKSAPSVQTDTAHISRNSLDWAGAYIHDRFFFNIQLNSDLTYVVLYIDRESLSKIFSVHRGTFRWNELGNKVTLQDKHPDIIPSIYLVGKNTLTAIDENGNTIFGPRAETYVLRKTKSNITEIYWKLIELNGEPVHTYDSMPREPYMTLKDEGNRIIGHGGCNSFNGLYELGLNYRIAFSQISSTLMACPHLAVEKLFFRALEAADNYTVSGDTLSLNKARMAPLARFAAVYMK